MKKASEYRRHAEECRELAARMASPAHRSQLLQMAKHWDGLAADRVALIQRHPELAQAGEQEEEASRAGSARQRAEARGARRRT